MIKLRQTLIILVAGASAVSLGLSGCQPQQVLEKESSAATPTQSSPDSTTQAQVIERDVPYVPTPEPVVAEMLRIANVNENDVIYDLGSGDGRIVLTAARKYGARGVGVDIDPELVQKANENARAAGLDDRVKFIQQDLFETDISDASVVTLYLLSDVNLKLRPKLLAELKPGTRIVSHAFDMGNWEPEQVVQVEGRTIYYWVVPEEVPEQLRS